MKARWLVALERRPWVPAIIASLGTTLLVLSALALLAPPEFLDAAVALGDRQLALILLALFAIAASVFRISFRRRPSAEEEVDEGLGRAAPAGANGAGSAHPGAENLAPAEPRTHLR